MDETECFETSTHKIQTPGNHPEEMAQHSEQDESLKSRKIIYCLKKNIYFPSYCFLMDSMSGKYYVNCKSATKFCTEFQALKEQGI